MIVTQLILVLLTSASLLFAEESIDEEKNIAASQQNKMTIREAKAECKAEGKKGRELVACIKEKIKK